MTGPRPLPQWQRLWYKERMPTIYDADELLTTREVADLCKVTTTTVTRWVKSGHLTGTKLGPKTFRFRRSDVEDLLAAGSTAPDSEASPQDDR